MWMGYSRLAQGKRFYVVASLAASLAALPSCSSSGGSEPGAGRSETGGEGEVTAPSPSSSPPAPGPSRPSPAGTPVATHGALRVAGTKIVDAQGSPIALRGMSLFWSQWGSAFWNAAAVDTLATDWKTTVVRAAMGVDQGGYLQSGAVEKARVTTVVEAAIARGLYVIVDWHDHDAHLHLDAAKAFFDEMAGTYGASPNVLFEIWNEPIEVPWSTVKSYATTILSTIRGRGAKNVVIVGSPHWSQDVDAAAAEPLADANTAYALHFYANTPAHRGPLRAKAMVAINAGRALFVTEWGTSSADGNGTVNATESQVWLDFLATNGIGWCNWSLFDKPEAASALVPGTLPTGPWSDSALTPSGTFVRDALRKP